MSTAKDRREAARRAFHASWMAPIDELGCTAEAFRYLRATVLNLTQKEAARLLRVSVSTVKHYEHGVYPPVFSAFLALLLVSESQRYRLAPDTTWAGWSFVERYDPQAKAHVTLLVNEAGLSFTVEQLEQFGMSMQKASWLQSENYALREQIEAIGEVNDAGALTAELRALRDGIEGLLDKIRPAVTLKAAA